VLVIILPGHTTHVLQAIDVGLTGPLKSAFKQKLDEITHPTILDADGHVVQVPLTQVSADRARWMLVKSFIHGSQASCTLPNITSAFERSGLCPFDINKPFNTGYVTDPAENICKTSMATHVLQATCKTFFPDSCPTSLITTANRINCNRDHFSRFRSSICSIHLIHLDIVWYKSLLDTADGSSIGIDPCDIIRIVRRHTLGELI
jgi:hypothetical protein